MTTGAVVSRDFEIDPTLICSTPATCATATLKQRGTGCSASDTLTFFLDNNVNCDAAATWQYDPAFFNNVFMNGDSIQLLPKKTGAYTISATIEGSCLTNTQSMSSAVALAASQVSAGPDTLWCKGQTIQIGATPGYQTYTWNDGSINDSLNITAPGKYYVTVTDICGGTGSDTVLVTDAGLVFRISGNTTKCNNDTVSLQASSGYYNYQWTPLLHIQATNHTALVSPDTDMRYYVTAEKWAGCTLIDSILITTLSSPALQLRADTSLCTGDSIKLQAAAGFKSYQWSNGETSTVITVKTSGRFSVTATYNNGCQSRDTFNLVELYRNPQPDLDKNELLCSGATRVLQPTQHFSSYSWSDGSNGHSMEVDAVGTYYVDVVDQRGCKGSDTSRITAIAPLPANFLPDDTTICQFGKLTILPVEQYRAYHWNDLSMAPSLTIQQPGRYWLTVIDKNSCEGSDSILVTSKQCLVGLYVPNAFTPNGDGKNEIFKPLLFGKATSFTFTVFNRWGGKVFETHTPNEGWNGRTNAGLADSGTYVWTCRYTLEGQPEKFEKGIVALIR
jgi:gliding motility-associated-like protein